MPIYRLDQHSPNLAERTYVAPSAVLIGQVTLEAGANVWFGAVLRGDNEPIIVGENSNIQENSVLHTDAGAPLHIGKNVTIGHSVTLHGCTIGDNSLIGMGSTLLNRAVIGKNCLIGANTLIPEGKVIPDRSLVVGLPGRIVRELTDEEVAGLQTSADRYVAQWQRYVRELGSPE